MSDYETLRQAHLAYAMALAPRLIERLDWPADRLADHRAQRLREVVREAIDAVAVASRAAGGGGCRPPRRGEPARASADDQDRSDGELRSDRRRRAAVTRRSSTITCGRVTAGSYLLDGYTAITSGGSTGERGVFVYDWTGWATFWVSVFRYLLRAKWSDPELASRSIVSAWVTAAHFTHASAALSRTFDGPDFVNVRLPVTLPTEELVAGLNEAQPGCPRRVSLRAARAELRGARGAAADRSAADPELRGAAAAGDQSRGRGGMGRARRQRLGACRRAAASASRASTRART